MTRRTYGQYCALARTLDLIGERWTLLVLRELVGGPKRYTDILDGLTGMNPTLLSKRLSDLQADGIIVRRHLPPPAASVVYELTDIGQELVTAMFPLVAWGARHVLGPRRRGEEFRLEWVLLAIRESIDRQSVADLEATYEFRVAGSVGHMSFHGGEIEVGAGAPESEPDVILTADLDAFVGVGTGRLDPAETMASGRLNVEGDGRAISRFAEVMGVTDSRWRAAAPTASTGRGPRV